MSIALAKNQKLRIYTLLKNCCNIPALWGTVLFIAPHLLGFGQHAYDYFAKTVCSFSQTSHPSQIQIVRRPFNE
ncbi:hypothetical protein ACEQPO_06430 [Bacillus sp. SL00103]